MKRLLCAVLLCLLLAGLCGCGKQAQTVAPGPWGVTIEEIDLSKPENKKYIKWAKEYHANWESYSKIFSAPNYFNVEAYVNQMGEEPDPWTYVWEDEENKELLEMHRSWNDTKELVIRATYENEYSGYNELLVREKATGETEQIAKGGISEFDAGSFSVLDVISDTRFLYRLSYYNYGPSQYYLYDLEIGGSICVASSELDMLCDLGNERYLWCDNEQTVGKRTLYLIDMRALEAGKKGAKLELVSWDSDYSSRIKHLSSDKRFVYMSLFRYSDGTMHRGIYNVETGEQVVDFELPDQLVSDLILINDDLEYGMKWFYSEDGPEVNLFYIIRYDRTGDKN